MALKRGDRGEAVERLQRALVAAGYEIDVDGIFGKETEDSVKEFQQSNGLEVDGKVGPDTLEALGVAEGDTSFDINVPGTVPALAQPSSNTCWATVTTMMVSWRDAQSYSIADCMDAIGSEYRTKFDNDEGLHSAEKPVFLMVVGLVGEQPISYTVDGFRNLLEQYGPLWVTTDENHSRICHPCSDRRWHVRGWHGRPHIHSHRGSSRRSPLRRVVSGVYAQVRRGGGHCRSAI